MNNKPKLLIVEDDEWILDIFTKVLAKNFEINTAQTIHAFYSSIKNNTYDGFLVDLSLRGDKNGLQLIEELRKMENYLETPIVVVTANALRKDRDNSLKAGATKFITKPVENKVLLQEFVDLFPNLVDK
jgi:two-component system, chemotaxis family, sensor kinase CheA